MGPNYSIHIPMTNLANAILSNSKISSCASGEIIEILVQTSSSSESAREQIVWPDINYSKLFVRKFYSHVVNNLMQNIDPKSAKRRFVILGSPGISKSGFGNYLLYTAFQLKKTIVYANGRTDTKCLFTYDNQKNSYTAIRLSNSSLELSEYLNNPTTIFISDSMESTPVREAFTILITSPKRSRWTMFNASNQSITSLLVFNPFTKDELLALRDTCFPHVSNDIMWNKFLRWGGNALTTFELDSANDKVHFEYEPAVDQKISMELLLHRRNLSIEQQTGDVNLVNRLFHFATSGYARETFDESLFTDPKFYEFTRIKVASLAVIEYVSKEAKKYNLTLNDLINLLPPEPENR